MTTPSGSPSVRRLPSRAVLVELSASADAVEADPGTLPAIDPVPAWRRWGWAVALVPTAALIVYQRLAPGQGWSVPDAVVLLAMLGLLVTAVLALVRYEDDRAVARLVRGRDALLAAPARATGTLTLPVAGAREAQPNEAETLRATLVVTPASGEPTTRPVRVVVPAGTAGPRPGDPVAVWHAADDADATGVLLVRYHRAWADDLVAALRDRADAAATTPEGADEHPRNPADPGPGSE